MSLKGVGSGQDINTVRSAMAFERPREKMCCARLGVGEAMVRLPDRYRFPFLIRTKDIKKIPVRDEKVRDMAREHLNQNFHFGPGTVTGLHPRCAEYHVFSR